MTSPPMWGCGLKFLGRRQYALQIQSPPMWGCGLKSRGRHCDWRDHGVTPYVGVWIEIA